MLINNKAILIISMIFMALAISACSTNKDSATDNTDISDEREESNQAEENRNRQIKISNNSKTIVFELNDSSASQDLLNQLPLTIDVEDYGSNEKIFYPPQKLDISNTEKAKGGQQGSLAYYAPWGDVVLFYSDFNSADGLYELGKAVSGDENIENISGKIEIEKLNN